ncbi:hypothetical protein M9458_049518, partial [Cirrhinus mrigala]
KTSPPTDPATTSQLATEMSAQATKLSQHQEQLNRLSRPIGTTKLTTEERERRLRNNLCLYCGQARHIRATCPTRPPRPPTS